MAIGRISGPMLFANLERQGLDLQIDGNLVYFDVTRRRVGFNTNNPEYTVEIFEDNRETPATLFVHGNIIAANNIVAGNNLTAASVTVANAYTLPTYQGAQGDVLISDGVSGVYWSSGTATNLERRKYYYKIEELPVGANVEWRMDLGCISSIVYNLTVSRPCLVEVFATALRNEVNPYTFLATLDHLMDDGRVLLDDGSVIQSRQYNIFANQEEPVKPYFYARVTNTDGIGGNVELNLTYYTLATDTQAGTYNFQLVDQLPVTGYQGQVVIQKDTMVMYVWVDTYWRVVSPVVPPPPPST